MKKEKLPPPTVYSKYNNSFTNTAFFFSLFEKGGSFENLFRWIDLADGLPWISDVCSEPWVDVIFGTPLDEDNGDETEVERLRYIISQLEEEYRTIQEHLIFSWVGKNEDETILHVIGEISSKLDECQSQEAQINFLFSILKEFAWLSERLFGIKDMKDWELADRFFSIIKGFEFAFYGDEHVYKKWYNLQHIQEVNNAYKRLSTNYDPNERNSYVYQSMRCEVECTIRCLYNIFQRFLSKLDVELLQRKINLQALEDESNIVLTWRKDDFRQRYLYKNFGSEYLIKRLLAEALPKGKSTENNADMQQGEIIPKDMFPDRVKNYFQLAADKGYLSQKEDGYTWHKSKVLCACFCGLLWAGDKYQLVNNEYIFIKGYNLPEKECNRIFNQNTLGASRLQVNGISPRGFKEMIQDIFLVKKNDS